MHIPGQADVNKLRGVRQMIPQAETRQEKTLEITNEGKKDTVWSHHTAAQVGHPSRTLHQQC